MRREATGLRPFSPSLFLSPLMLLPSSSMTSPYPRHVHASRTCSILSVLLHSLNATILSFLSLRLSQETSGRIDCKSEKELVPSQSGVYASPVSGRLGASHSLSPSSLCLHRQLLTPTNHLFACLSGSSVGFTRPTHPDVQHFKRKLGTN